MKIPLLDLKTQYESIKDEIENVLKDVIKKQAFVLGNEVRSLEDEIAHFSQARYGIGVASGTDALFLSLKALGIERGDEVITTPFTFIATAEVISYLNAKPVFVDIDRKTYNIDPSLIESKITKRTKAIMPVHLYGQCADMDAISEIAKKNGLKVIEDCAQSIGATYKGRKAGSLGDLAAFSFFPSKNLGGFGDGGMVVTNDKALAEKIKVLRVHGSTKRYYHDVVGYNSRLDNLQAAVLRVKLKFLQGWIEKRQQNAAYYNEMLSGVSVITPFVPEYNTHTYHQYVLASESRDDLLKYINSKGIESRVYYPIPLHLQKCYSDLGYRKGDLPISEWAAANTLAVPVYSELKKMEVEAVAGCIKDFLK
ncbi:MAG: DegT/DnrJ/EryC1/StrS family aminotransferase [Candidatus Omnitrophica bacterium]|nr:DegT/DnrJ/EryC1/StrS family aminotransferase [Candidatus Omnitrophota bacterium]